jgi:hypothetical protein
MAVHAIYLHTAFCGITSVAIMGKLNWLLDFRTQVVSCSEGLRRINGIAASGHNQSNKQNGQT